MSVKLGFWLFWARARRSIIREQQLQTNLAWFGFPLIYLLRRFSGTNFAFTSECLALSEACVKCIFPFFQIFNHFEKLKQ